MPNKNKQVDICWKFNGDIAEIKFHIGYGKQFYSDNILPVIHFIKLTIPVTARSYDPYAQKWEIAKEYWPPIETLLVGLNWNINDITNKANPDEPDISHIRVDKAYEEKFYHEQQILSTQESKESVAIKLAGFFAAPIEDFNSWTEQQLKKSYRQLAMQLHPDRNNGDGTQMSELNRLWSIYNSKGE